MKTFSRPAALLTCALAIAFIAESIFAKEKIESITDLPVRSYATGIAPSEMLNDAAALDELRSRVRSDIEQVLDRYDLQDEATLRRFFGVLSTVALLEGRNDDAARYWEKVRELEEKESARYMTGLSGASLVAARNAGEPGAEA